MRSTDGGRSINDNVEMPRAGTHASRRGAVDGGSKSHADGEPIRLLLVVPFSPRKDTRHGGRVVAQLLDRLVDRHHVALVYLRHPGTGPVDETLARRCQLVREVELTERGDFGATWRRRLHVVMAPLTGYPAAVADLRERGFVRACLEVQRRWRPDVVQVEHDDLAHCGLALRRQGGDAALVLTCHEPGALASEHQAQTTSGRQRLAHRINVIGWGRYWSRTLPAFDAVVTFTDSDRAVIERSVAGLRFATIGLGIDVPEEPLSPTGSGEPNVMFVGGYRHPPNTDAALRLLRRIMPAVRERRPGLSLVLVGADPGTAIIRAATGDDTVTGAVPAVTPFLDAASLVVLPLRTGGGMRVKLLEALVGGKAVVASRLAAAGLELTDRREIVFAETDAEFAEAILDLIDDREAREALGGNARAWAVRNLTWDSRVDAYEDLYGSLLATRP